MENSDQDDIRNDPPTRLSTDSPRARGGSGVQLVEVSSEHAGQRIDNFLMRELKGVPRTHVYRIIRRGDVRIDKKRCKPERKLKAGELVRVPPYSGPDTSAPAKLSDSLRARLIELIIAETDNFIVINKPSGMPVHGGSGIRLGLIEAVRQISPELRLAELAHRLDRETSGCLLIAKNAPFLKFAQNQFRAKTVNKEYLALVHGRWPEGIDYVDAKLLKDALGASERIVRVSEEGKPAMTRFKIERLYGQATLMRALPETGRTHQIRVHCQFAGHPIVGDTKYTPKSDSKGLLRASSLCLHAQTLAFDMSPAGDRVHYHAELDAQFAELLLNLENH